MEPEAPPRPRPPDTGSPTRIALRRLRRDRTAMACLAVVLFFVLVAVFAPVLAGWSGQNPFDPHFDLIDEATSLPLVGMTPEHWFGVEPRLGRDLFARWAYGARPSLLVAAIATAVSAVVGVTVGLVSGFVGGWVDRVLSWVMDLLLSLPYLLFAIATPATLMAVLGLTPDDAAPEVVSEIRFYSLILVLSVFGWASLARLIRGEVLSLREREFIAAARVLGVPTYRVLARELLPNLVAPIVISISMALPGYIVAEAGLTFLGVGLTEPTPSWGVTISAAVSSYEAVPHYLWLPVLSVTALVLALSLLGDAVRDAFDPKTRR
ncbi:peptide ABC transporter permease [Pilimelia anulata]|uniref:Peptide ABC transporter permease n=1 Tax=Pilimelia anulata TaxID=53371 RepID=A0A8J3BD19_9ACTN|nr:ABC transporter permease [Pilimelia anulata]GGJ98013.1 peptide ABC transporter permease [Pilimelia anulata]